ncbi:hypothetical protein [Olivibacter sitiensis]|nr:hypothetical protein [Olivibacter sitiensis]
MKNFNDLTKQKWFWPVVVIISLVLIYRIGYGVGQLLGYLFK